MIARDFSICKIRNIAQVDFTDEFCFVGKTDPGTFSCLYFRLCAERMCWNVNMVGRLFE